MFVPIAWCLYAFLLWCAWGWHYELYEQYEGESADEPPISWSGAQPPSLGVGSQTGVWG